ncbi:BQ5605_C005g03355 [Microbotryum silenes-dioicae]|uniref:BQ5605_C005g03355 protein n=1 Tax=Microbotryum silenes-dioicae TaxID=796604 RepID=A0A2X0MAF1_9BASI|nr:BQ5605_C005g03355 [Microbotryum silenes-dioicae]
MTLGPFAFASRRASQCSRLYRPGLLLTDDDFDRVSPLTNMTIAELLAFDVSCRSRRRVSSHRVVQGQAHPIIDLPYLTLQTRDAFLATDALTNARKNGYRPLAVASTSNGVETTATPLEIGSLICFGLELRLIEKACYFTHIDGTVPFCMIEGRQDIDTCAHAEQRLPPFGACPGREMPPVESLQAAQLPPRIQRAQVQENVSLTTK